MERTSTFGGQRDANEVIPEPQLRVLFSPEHGATASPAVRLPDELVLGRGTQVPELASLANDSAASRQHVRVVRSPGGASVVDLGSRNGTFVNGERIRECELQSGDVLRVGGTLLLYRHEPFEHVDGLLPPLRGRARTICHARALLAAAATSPATILLLGESGTGKTVAARGVHEASGREGPFVHVNCAAIPEPLAESTLFGHVAGAFTDAKRDRVGHFRAAHNGTLFLDEIGELPLAVQSKLLTVIEDRNVTPLGGSGALEVDVRIIAATNVDLQDAVTQKAFRGDLYARVSEFVVALPALRERREDVLLLFADALSGSTIALDTTFAEALVTHAWPYNVRELQKIANTLKILFVAQPKDAMRIVTDRLLAARTDAHADDVRERASSVAPRLPRDSIPTKEELVALLSETCGTISAIADRTGRSRKQVYRWLEQYGLELDSYRSP